MQRSFKLTRPIKTAKGEIAEIELREPTGDLYLEHGPPYETVIEVDGDGAATGWRKVKPLPAVIRAYVRFMTGLGPAEIGALHPADLQRLYSLAVETVNAAGNSADSPPSS